MRYRRRRNPISNSPLPPWWKRPATWIGTVLTAALVALASTWFVSLAGPRASSSAPSLPVGTSQAPSASPGSSVTSSVPDAPVVAVRRLGGLLGDGTGFWIVSKPPQDLPPLPADETGVEQWVSKTGAIDSYAVGSAALTNLQVTIQGSSSAQIILTGIDFVVVSRRTGTIHGGLVSDGAAGATDFRYVAVNLDSKPPKIIASYPNYLAGSSDPPWERTPVRFPYFVTNTSSEVFNIVAYTHNYVTWYAELLWSVNGRNGESIINDGGKPFETAAGSLASAAYGYNGHNWQVCSKGDMSCT
jgi:hypothetical protein